MALNLPIKTKLAVPGTDEGAFLYAMPGGQVISEDMAGNLDKELNYEYTIKSKSAEKANDQLWQVTNFIEELSSLPSANNSYQFEDIKVTSQPSQSKADEQGYFYWLVSLQARLTIFKEETHK